MYSITRDMIVEYHRANYFGKNLIVVGGGGIDHKQLCDYVDRHFGKLGANPVHPRNMPGKPSLKSEVFLMESELTENLNISVFYEAPPWNHPNYYDFLLFQRLLADRPENFMETAIFQRTH
jgi:predicted Zn-dependent peptidase